MLLQNANYQADTRPFFYHLSNRGKWEIYFTEVSQISDRMLISNKKSLEKNKQKNPTIDMAKTAIKSEKLTPFGGIFLDRRSI